MNVPILSVRLDALCRDDLLVMASNSVGGGCIQGRDVWVRVPPSQMRER
jgi:hypothetical protein